MFWRAVLAFLALPGIVAIAAPAGWVLFSGAHVAFPIGIVVLVVGTLLLLWCVRDFLVVGRGTLAPWDPATQLVVVGLYRVSRNPMYVAVLTMLLGWALTFGSWGLLAYAVVVAIAFHARVVFGEEPELERTFGVQWQDYSGKVPRWFGRVRRR